MNHTEKLREYALLLRRWDAFELGGQVPAALDYLDLAKTLEEAAALIEHMQFALDRLRDHKNQET